MYVYLINLERRSDRLRIFKTQALKENIMYQRIPAIDGLELDRRDIWTRMYEGPTQKRSLKKSEIGCYLSHYMCYQDAYKNNRDWTVIFEDDVKIPGSFWQKVTKMMIELPSDADILLLGASPLWRNKYEHLGKLKRCTLNLNKVLGEVYGLHGYIVRKKALKTLLECKFPVDAPMDIKITYLGLNVYIPDTDIVKVNKLGSNTQCK